MGLISALSIPFAYLMGAKNKHWINNPIQSQERVFKGLVSTAKHTLFGKDHSFEDIKSYQDFVRLVPVRDYEGLKSYIDKIITGQKDVLWKGRPLYFTKTSGTTSGTKFIPISKESMPFHLKSAKDAMLSYIKETKDASFIGGKTIFIQGSPQLDDTNGIPTGRLSGIVAHHLPWYLKRNNLPSFDTNSISDWEQKVDAIIEETLSQNMTLISGIPPWVQMYFEKIQKRTNQPISTVFPDFSLMIHGGVNFKPYKQRFEKLIGKSIPSIETYPASEGFIAYQDSQSEEGLLLCVNHGMFFEFIESTHFFNDHPTRISLAEVEMGKDYVVILNTNAGLWGYNIGDTIRFVSTSPYRIIVTGRIKHYTSAFGEHVIGKEVEKAMYETTEKYQVVINEFHVSPQVNPLSGLPYHEWFIEFKSPPNDMAAFANTLNESMCSQNTYYNDLINGKVLCPLKISCIVEGGFYKMMKERGKLGGQNKPPRLSNDRLLADKLTPYAND